jgi:hypothetical protein
MIERQTIDGRDATIAYLTNKFAPATADTAQYVKVVFDDGEMFFLLTDIPPGTQPPENFEQVARVKNVKTFKTFKMAIAILDKSEIEMRDLIERDLQNIAGVSGTKYGNAMRAVDKLMAKIKRVRLEAIKASFRHIRDHSS